MDFINTVRLVYMEMMQNAFIVINKVIIYLDFYKIFSKYLDFMFSVIYGHIILLYKSTSLSDCF